MKRLIYSTFVLALVVAAYWAGGHRRNPEPGESHDGRRILHYVDPMNPAHTSDRPGKAPCGMDMEPVYADSLPEPGEPAERSLPADTVKVSPEKQQLIGVRLATVEKKSLVHNLRLLGKVATDETRIYRINATVDGWITKTRPVSTGSRVTKDQTLAEFYSPEFLAAGQALLFALNSADRIRPTGQETEVQRSQMASFELSLKQSRDTLRNLGMGELQIQELIQSRNRVENVDITSPANGFILLRNVSDGQRFDKGTELFRIADLSRVWILVDVFERDASLVRSDQPVKLELPNQGRTFEARMTETLPQFDNITRTMKLRLEADNADFVLKPDMFVDVELPLSLAESLVVPAEAVLDAGLRQTVFVALGDGYFEPRRVQVGARLGEQVQITQGLKAGENIVVSGNFLLDSESRMKMAVAHAQDKAAIDPVCGMTLNKLTAVHTREIQGVLYYFCSEDCEKKFAAAPTKYQAKAELQRGAGSATMGASGRDPVCGMPVDEAKARSANLTSQWRGKTFWFCSPSCKKQFEIAPDKYLTPSASN